MPRHLACKLLVIAAGLACAATTSRAQQPTPQEGDFVVRDFHFHSNETLPEARLHYWTLGQPVRDAQGRVTNAVLILHGTGGTGRNFLGHEFAGVLFGPGQLLDAARYYIIFPDALGHGRSSKPSDSLHMRFPKYDYSDIVTAHYRLVTEGLKVNHLRLVIGTSMGCMNTWMWGEAYPDFMDALMPLACYPAEIGGRNWMQRQMRENCITSDPQWNGGEYEKEPVEGLTCVMYIRTLMVGSALQMQMHYPTRESVLQMMDKTFSEQIAKEDANDIIYAEEASRNYNPEPDLSKIKAPVMAINSADDEINPPELGIAEREIKKVKRGRFILLPITEETRGHGTHSLPAIWGKYLAELLEESK